MATWEGTWCDETRTVLVSQGCPGLSIINRDLVKDIFPGTREKSKRNFRDVPILTEDPGIILDPKVAIDSLNQFLAPIKNLTDKAADSAGLDECGFCRFVRGLLPWLLLALVVWLVRKFLKR